MTRTSTWRRLQASPSGELVRQGGLAFFLASGLLGISNFAFHVVVSRILGPSSYGALSSLLNAILVVSVPLGGVQAAVTHRVASDRGGSADLRAMAVRSVLWGIAGSGVLAASSPLIASFLRLSSPMPVLVLSIWVMPAVIGAVLQGVLVGEVRFGPVALATLAGGGAVRLVVGLGLVSAGFGVDGAMFATVAGAVVTTLILLWALRAELGRRRAPGPRVSVRLGLSMIAALGGYWVFVGLDVALARHFLSARSAGVYAAAATGGRIALFVPAAVVTLAYPRFAGVASGPRIRLLAHTMAVVAAIGAASAGVIALAPHLFIRLLFGAEYGGSAALVGILALNAALLGVLGLLTYFHLAKRSRIAHMSWIASAVAALLIALSHRTGGAIARTMFVVTALTVCVEAVCALSVRTYAEENEPRRRPRSRDPRDGLQSTTEERRQPWELPDRLRILVYNWRDLGHERAGGAEVFTHNLALGWIEQGHEVTFFCASSPGRPEREEVDGVQVIRRGSRFSLYREAERFWHSEGAGRYDLVLDSVNTRPFLTPDFLGTTPVVALIYQVAREVWRYEIPWPLSWVGRFLLEPAWLSRYRDRPVVTISESSRDSLRRYGLNDVSVVPVGRAPAARSVLPPAREPVPTVAFVGRLSANKRPDHAIRAFQLMRQKIPDAQMWVMGTGPMERSLREHAPPGVQLLGWVSEQERQSRVARAHVLVVTSVREGWGLVVTEAAEAGTPTVAYDVAGLRDSVRAVGGVLTEASPTALAAVLSDVLPRFASGALPSPGTSGIPEWREVGDQVLVVARRWAASAASSAAGEVVVAGEIRRERRLRGLRRTLSGVAIGALCLLGLSGSSGAPTVGAVAVACLVLAVALAALETRAGRPHDSRVEPAVSPAPGEEPDHGDSRTPSTATGRPSVRAAPRRASPGTYRGACALVVTVAALAVQTWFVRGTMIAGGDIAPPVGTAWLAHVFSPTGWSGSGLGGPAALETQLPWASVLYVVRALGGSAGVAQRVLLVGLFVGAGVAAFALLRALRLPPLAASIGALVYLFNPYVVSEVGVNSVYLTAMVLVAAVPACLVAAGSGSWTPRQAAVGVALSAPLLGTAYENPPLAGMVLVLAVATPALIYWLDGRQGAARALRALALGIPLLAGLSAYWLVPSLVQVTGVASSALSSTAGWAFTEARTTLANGLWLNTTWGWRFPEYFPYAHLYSSMPLALLKYALPAAAFGGLAFALTGAGAARGTASRLVGPVGRAGRAGPAGRQGRLIVAFGGLALFLVVFATGTNQPGAVVFDPLYHLPYGWLLREPGRFLMGGALAYGVLVAVTVTLFSERFRSDQGLALRGGDVGAIGRTLALLAGAAVLILLPGYPLASGAVVPDHRPLLPSEHVRVPGYWSEMASYLGSSAPPGNLLVLPPDDFYQMPYRWGYYGNDGFIIAMIGRNVLDPSPQSYVAVPPELTATVDEVSNSLLAHDWSLASKLLDALGTPQILLRGDISPSFPGRSIVSPARLAAALFDDPLVHLTRRIGPLELYSELAPSTPTSYVTVNRSSPDLRVLGLFRAGTGLVTSPMRRGVSGVLELPALSHWHLAGNRLTASLREPAGWRYRVDDMASSVAPPGLLPLVAEGLKAPFHESLSPYRGGAVAHFSLPVGGSLIRDGSFRSGEWSRVGNCAAFAGTLGQAHVSALVRAHGGPGGLPALELSAQGDSSCVSEISSWHRGPVLVDLWARRLSGSPPRICLWESNIDQCAALSPLPDAGGWVHYQSVTVPAPGTTSIRVYLYGDVLSSGQATADEYAGVQIRSVPSLYQPVVVATPRVRAASARLAVDDNAYSTYWQGPSASTHLLVDGLRNGWIGAGISSARTVSFEPAAADEAARWVSVLTALLLGAMAVSALLRRRRRGSRKRERRHIVKALVSARRSAP